MRGRDVYTLGYFAEPGIGQRLAPIPSSSGLRTWMTRSLIQRRIARAVAARLVLHEDLGDLRMPDRLAGIVGQ